MGYELLESRDGVSGVARLRSHALTISRCQVCRQYDLSERSAAPGRAADSMRSASRGRTARPPRALQPPPHLLTTLSAPAGGGRCVCPVAPWNTPLAEVNVGERLERRWPRRFLTCLAVARKCRGNARRRGPRGVREPPSVAVRSGCLGASVHRRSRSSAVGVRRPERPSAGCAPIAVVPDPCHPHWRPGHGSG